MTNRLKRIFSRLRGKPKKPPAPIGAADLVVAVVVKAPVRVARGRGEYEERTEIAARVSARRRHKAAEIMATSNDPEHKVSADLFRTEPARSDIVAEDATRDYPNV